MNDGMQILLVEDDADTRSSLIDILELDGHQVLVAASLAEARKIVTEYHECTCVVILDRRLPDGTAEGFLPELKRLAPATETVVVTGYADMDSTISALRSGVADYLIKPINPDALRSCLNRIAERRRIESELQSEQQFASRVLATAEAIVLILDLDGCVIRVNPYFERISGWSQEELVGQNWFVRCIPERERDWVRNVFVKTATNFKSEGVINSILTKDRKDRKIRWSNTTLRDPAGDVTSVLAVGIDVTDFLLAQERVRRSERLALIGQTMTALAHESRNALQRISAGVEILALDFETNQDVQRDLQSIQRATNDLHQILEEVRSFAAPIVLGRESASIPEIWRRVWRQLGVTGQNRDAKLQERIEFSDQPVSVDVLRMEQVFRNLFDNALAACDDPVRITIECSTSTPGQVQILFRDNGPGLTSEQREKLFEPFFTTKSSGTGLGMSIVQRIVEAHQGNIFVEELNDQANESGASFVIQLPLHCVK